jgi:hypothetical protein
MWNLGPKIREIERTQHSVTIAETATTVAAVGFGLLSFTPIVATYHTDRLWFGILVSAGFASVALYASVRSTFTAN